MPVSVEWYNTNKTILVLHMQGKWNISELNDAIDTIEQMVEPINHECISVTVFENGYYMPKNLLSSVTTLRKKRRNDQFICSIVVSTGTIEFFTGLLQKVMPNSRLYSTKTFDEAIEMAEELLTSLTTKPTSKNE